MIANSFGVSKLVMDWNFSTAMGNGTFRLLNHGGVENGVGAHWWREKLAPFVIAGKQKKALLQLGALCGT